MIYFWGEILEWNRIRSELYFQGALISDQPSQINHDKQNAGISSTKSFLEILQLSVDYVRVSQTTFIVAFLKTKISQKELTKCVPKGLEICLP